MPLEQQRFRPRPPRVPLRCPVRFRGEGVDGTGTVVDLSTHGVKVTGASMPVKLGDVSLSLALPDMPKPLVADAVVRWSRGNSFGVTFQHLPADARERLSAVLGAYAAQMAFHAEAAPTVWSMVQGSVRQTRWLPAVVVGSVLGAALAVGLVYYGKLFYQYGPDPYVPKDEERLLYEARKDAVKRAKRDDVIIPP